LKVHAAALLAIVFSAASLPASAMDECARVACEAQKGRWSCAEQGVPGDGSAHDFSVRSGSRDAAFVCGHSASLRQGLDKEFVSDCMLNPEQPPSVENAPERRCTRPSDDLAVESCVEFGGANPTLSCRYVNATGARVKTVQLCGCWR
jgi:hypothetical protein